MSENQAESAREPWCPRPGQPCASPLCALEVDVNDCARAVRQYADAVSIANGGTTLTEFLLDQDLSNRPARWGHNPFADDCPHCAPKRVIDAVRDACDLAEGEARQVVDDEVYVSVGLIRNALNPTTPPEVGGE